MTPQENHKDQQAEIELEERVQALRNEAEDLRSLMKQRFGDTDARANRAGEVCDALQRLRWEMERTL
jgi:hypothetical protein